MWLTNVGITATTLKAALSNKIDGRVVVAGTSQMFTAVDVDPYVNEEAPMSPKNYFAKTKGDRRKVVEIFKELDPSIGRIAKLFKHEPPRRGPRFVSTDIMAQVMQVIGWRSREVSFRSPFARIDLNYARDAVMSMDFFVGN